VELDVAGAVHTGRWTARLSLCNETYFQTMRRPLRQGRGFTADDVETGRSKAFAAPCGPPIRPRCSLT